MKPKSLLRGAALLCWIPGAALAQSEPAQSAEFFQPNPGNSFFSVRAAQLLRAGQFQLSAFLNFADDPVVTIEREGEQEVISRIVDNQSALDLGVAYGIKDWVELSLALPLALVQNGDALPGAAAIAVSGAKLGDIRLGAKFRVLGDPRAQEGFFLSVVPELSLPTGSEADFFGDAGLVFRVPVAAEIKQGAFRAGATAGPRFQPEVSLGNAVTGDSLDLGLGLSYQFSPRVSGLAEANGALPFAALRTLSEEGAIPIGSSPSEARAGAKIKLAPGFWLPVGLGAGLSSGIGAPDFRVFAGLQFAPELPEDLDSDGILDAADQCPAQPEDKNGIEDRDGCPDDPDGDRVASSEDACPREPGSASAQGCPDQDGDTFADAADQCPAESEDKNGIEDTDGCPDDPDGDNILGAADQCPREPGSASAQGCPDQDGDTFADATDQCPAQPGTAAFSGCPDTDSDGLADAKDRCPVAAEDKDGIQDEDGCPEEDADSDAFADAKDICPLDPEDNKGTREGCPESVKASIKDGAIFIMDKVYFDTSRASLQKRSFAILDTVAELLLAHPELVKVQIAGHTDDESDDKSNLKLSEARAKTVMKYLVSKGVPAERLVAAGFGESTPLVPIDGLRGKDLKAAREQNRRVEFTILSE